MPDYRYLILVLLQAAPFRLDIPNMI